MKSVNKVILIGNLGCGVEKGMKVGGGYSYSARPVCS
jgi:hypothetical protein